MMTSVSWLWDNWWSRLASPWVEILLVFSALLSGILVGGERHRREKPAGIRTISLVCLGSCVFTILSLAFTSNSGDSGRVAAQIVTGIGFLGGGVILHGRRMVNGVTTAAIIWITAAIGMTVGAGYPFAGLALGALVNRFMVFSLLFETKWHPDAKPLRVTLDYLPRNGLTRVRLERILINYEESGVTARWNEETADAGQVTLAMALPRVHTEELLAELVDVPDVCGLRREPAVTARTS